MIKKYVFLVIVICGISNYSFAKKETRPESKDPGEVLVTGQNEVSKWFQSESSHFEIFSDTSREEINELLDQLEKFDYVLRVFTNTALSPSSKVKQRLYITRDFDDLSLIRSDKPTNAVAFFATCPSGTTGFAAKLNHKAISTGELDKKHEQNESYTYIFEAYARHFLYTNTNLRSPNWFIDGFASYFSTMRFVENKAVIGRPPQPLIGYLNYLNQGGLGLYHSLSFEEVLADKEDALHNVLGKQGVALEFQAKAWILTHYILSSSTNLTAFKKYLEISNSGAGEKDAFLNAFGFKASDIRNKLWAYRKKNIEALIVDLPNLPVTSPTYYALPISADRFLLASAAIDACPSSERSAKILDFTRKNLEKYKTSEFAVNTNLKAEIRWGDFTSAADWLTKETNISKKDYAPFRNLGIAKMNLAANATSLEAKATYYREAKIALLKAYKIEPTSAEVSYLFYRASVLSEVIPSEESLGAALLAYKYNPNNDLYVKNAALVNEYIDNKVEYKRLLSLMANNKRNVEYRTWAANTLAQEASLTKETFLSEMRKVEPVDVQSFTSWTLASSQVMADFENAAKTRNSALSIDPQSQSMEQNKQSQSGPELPR